MKVLITDNYNSYNAGDAAILEEHRFGHRDEVLRLCQRRAPSGHQNCDREHERQPRCREPSIRGQGELADSVVRQRSDLPDAV